MNETPNKPVSDCCGAELQECASSLPYKQWWICSKCWNHIMPSKSGGLANACSVWIESSKSHCGNQKPCALHIQPVSEHEPDCSFYWKKNVACDCGAAHKSAQTLHPESRTDAEALIEKWRVQKKQDLSAQLQEKSAARILDHDHWGMAKANNGICSLCTLEQIAPRTLKPPTPSKGESWEIEFDEFYTLPEMMIPGPQREKAIKAFISSLLEKEKVKIKQQYHDAIRKAEETME